MLSILFYSSKKYLLILQYMTLGYLLFLSPVKAEIIPDNTLTVNSSASPGCQKCTISGGTIRGVNLFHSFQDFSIPTGGEAFFDNDLGVSNILTRITGDAISNIDGLIRANGMANLFLLNPNGIIFGANARLNIGGSFYGSTANSIKFADGTEFIAKDNQIQTTAPLLTVSVPVGLQFGANPGSIQVQGNGQGIRITSDLMDTEDALRVNSNQTLALVGGDVNLDGATLKTAGGRIELGSLSGVGLVSLNPTEKGFSLGYDGVENFGDIQLFKQTAVDASGDGVGDIQIMGKLVSLTHGSQVEASTLGQGKGGNFTVNAQQKLQLIGNFAENLRSGLFAQAYPDTTGTAGDLIINTGELLVQDGGGVSASTFGAGRGGNLTVNAKLGVQLIGTTSDEYSISGLFTSADGSATGNAGNLTINTSELLVRDGAQIIAGTSSQGKGGDLMVNASQRVQIIGISPNGISRSGLFASNQPTATGDAGELTINTGDLLVTDGGVITATTFSEGKSGNLVINTNKLSVQDGALVSADTFGVGRGGNLTINTDDLLVRDGAQIGATTFGEGRSGNLTVNANQRVQLIGKSANGTISGLFANAVKNSTGNAGNLRIKAGELLVQDGAKVTVESLGQGTAGYIEVQANSIHLDNKALVIANTQSVGTDPNQQQAIITLHSGNLIMRNGSKITSNASGENVIGGNINLDTEVLAGLENSDISANSTDSRGGRVTINSKGIFGTQIRNLLTLESDITATGATPDLSGDIQINTPKVDPSRGLAQLPTNIEDITHRIAQGCSTSEKVAGEESKFTITGRTSLPSNPGDLFTGTTAFVELFDQAPGKISQSPNKNQKNSVSAESQNIEAQGWVLDVNGGIILVAQAPQITSHLPGITDNSCHLYNN
jgi:filamentous hemagglutinin family protein